MDDFADPGTPRRFGQPHRTDDVDRGVELWVGHRVAHVDLGSQVEHHLGTVLVEDGVQVRGHDVRLDKDVGRVVGQMLKVRRTTRCEIVQAHDRVAIGQ